MSVAKYYKKYSAEWWKTPIRMIIVLEAYQESVSKEIAAT